MPNMNQVVAMFEDLFSKYGMGDGCPIGNAVNRMFKSHLENRISGLKAYIIHGTTHNERVYTILINGTEVCIEGYTYRDFMKLPEEVRTAIASFYPTYEENWLLNGMSAQYRNIGDDMKPGRFRVIP